jgi:hypothetical protein
MSKLFTFCLDSCIVNMREKFVHDLGTWELMKGVQSGSAVFGEIFCRAVTWGSLTSPGAVT